MQVWHTTKYAMIIGALAVGCESMPDITPPLPVTSLASSKNPRTNSTNIVAYVDGLPIYSDHLYGPLVEVSGGQVLSDLIIDIRIAKKLKEQGLEISQSRIDLEKSLLINTLDPQDENQGIRLLNELKKRRGLGPNRFDRLLQRNAGLRLLVQDRVQITSAAMRQAFELRYGPRYHARLILTQTTHEAEQLRRRIEAGENFSDLAVRYSSDRSAARGGLLPPISASDPTYPQSVRTELLWLHEKKAPVSRIVDVEGGCLLLKLDHFIEPQEMDYYDIQEDLAATVRLQAEQVLMQQLAKELVSKSKILILDPDLEKSWQWQNQALTGTP